MTSFEVVVLIVGLVIGFTAAGVTSVASLKERQNRKKSRDLIPLIHSTQKEAANGERAASTASTVAIGNMLEDLTIRDYASNPVLASQIDAYFAGIKDRKDVRGDEQNQRLEKRTQAHPTVLALSPPLKVKLRGKEAQAVAIMISGESGKETQRYLVGLPYSQLTWVSSDAVSIPKHPRAAQWRSSIVRAERLARALGTTLSEMFAELERFGSSSNSRPRSG